MSPRRVPEMEAALAALGRVVVCELWGPGDPAALHPEELALVADAVDARVIQFAAGRQCARAAMAALGLTPVGLARGTGRSAAWPPTLWGSISHTDGYAAAVVGLREHCDGPLGIDAEQVGRVEDHLHRRLFLPEERAWLAALGEDDGRAQGAGDTDHDGVAARAATELFGLKECLYKAQFPLTGAWVGFHDVHIGGPARPDFEQVVRAWHLKPATDLPALDAVDWPCRGWSTTRRSGETGGAHVGAAIGAEVALTIVAAGPKR